MADMDVTVAEQVAALQQVLVAKDQQITALQAINVVISRRLEVASASVAQLTTELAALKPSPNGALPEDPKARQAA